ncbi:MAG: response regulator [Rhodospirillaceae bacterium]|nr:response regulator [Rhodospirillales bacterium]
MMKPQRRAMDAASLAAVELCRTSSTQCMVLAFPGLEPLAYSPLYSAIKPLPARDDWAQVAESLEEVGRSGVPVEIPLAGDVLLHGAPVVGEHGVEAVYVWTESARLADEQVRAAAQSAVAAKSRFLAAASHDLRQPFQAMRFFHSVLASHVTDDTAQRASDMLERALTSGEQLLNALLDISTLDAGTVQVRRQTFDLSELMDSLAAEFRPEAQAKGLSFRVCGPCIMVESDPLLVERIIRNILANAVRYTRQGGVLLGIRRRNGTARLEVWDTGFGIPEDQLVEVFEEFHQLDNPERDRSRGLGLGLAIVQRLARLLATPIEVHSRLGRGSVFSLILPLADLPGEDCSDAAGEAPMDVQARTVLVVEDDAMVLMGLQMILETWGLIVLPAEDMAQVLQRLDQAKPDLILSDLRLRAGLTGFEVVERVRTLMGGDIPAIILTGETGKAELAEGQRRNLTFLHKPIQAEPLKAAIARATEPVK